MTKKEKLLVSAISKAVPMVAKEWNSKKLAKLEEMLEDKYFNYFNDKPTEERTKLVAPFLDVIFARLMQKQLPGFKAEGGIGYDFKFGTIKIECKVTLGKGTGWTGNGYEKEPKHILLRYSVDGNGKIFEVFAMYVNLDKCESFWPVAGSTSNYSTLKFKKEDLNELKVAVGDLKVNPVYIKPVMKSL